MKDTFNVKQIGIIRADDEGFRLELNKEYREALTGLEGFQYVNVLWWFSGCDTAAFRSKLTETKPYTKGPDVLGAFAMRSPERPNPIALSCAYVTYLDAENGIIGLAYIDGEDGSPVLDIKPYMPSLDRVENPVMPDWCSHWPRNVESGGDFNWEDEFNF